MMPKYERPHPRRIYWHSGCLHEADHDAVGKHVAVAGGQSHVLADAGERVGRHPKFE
jgi:hypothetical protein